MNNKAITSLTLGIMSLFIPLAGFILGILGIIFANKGLKEIAESGEEGKNVAIAGKVCSIIGLCLQIGLIIFMVLGFAFFTSFEQQMP